MEEQEEKPGLLKRAFDYVFYTEERVGKDGRTFTIVKFRTMYRGVPEPPESQRLYSIFKGYKDDPRVTRVGRFVKPG